MTKLLILCLTYGASFSFAGDTIPLKKSSSAVQQSGTSENPSAKSDFMGDQQENGVIPGPGVQMPKPYVASLDTYGSPRLNEKVLRKFLGKELDAWIELGLKGDPRSLRMEAELARKVREKYDLAEANWSIVQAFDPGDLAFHIVLDVVEQKDKAERIPFVPNPKGEFKDPDNLIKEWVTYEATALKLVEAGELDPDTHECVAFHCPFGHTQAQLSKYGKIFVEGVKKNSDKLIKIMKEDRRADFRAGAVYLLAYLKDGNKVVELMVDRIMDPEPLVRNNALRVLGDIAEFHRQYIIPTKPILKALNFPRVSDRHKAVYIVYLLTQNSSKAKEDVLNSSMENLLAMLEAKLPDYRDLAHDVLRKVSGKDFPKTDVESWNRWYRTYSRDTAGMVTKKP